MKIRMIGLPTAEKKYDMLKRFDTISEYDRETERISILISRASIAVLT